MQSGDSGDWLAGAIWWMNVQPYGSPLIVFYGHLLNWLFPSHLVLAETFGFSVIPGAITVAFTYVITQRLAKHWSYALVASLVLIGAIAFTGQATILEEFVIGAMFLTMAVWCYINGRKKLTALCLGLAAMVNIICVIISLIWFILHIRELKVWKSAIPIFVACCFTYVYVLVLMALPTPKLLAGWLSLHSLNSYLGSSGTIGSLSLAELWPRVPQFVGVFVISLGFAVVPLFIGLKTKRTKIMTVMLCSIIFNVWCYALNVDPITWHFLPFTFPMIAVFVGVGLSRMKRQHLKLVGYGACALIALNAVFLNANLLTQANPKATNYEKALEALPDGSAVVIASGGPYQLGMIYVMAQGKNLVPIYYTGMRWYDPYYLTDARYIAYSGWIKEQYNVTGINTQAQVQDLLNQGRNVYLLLPMVTPYWDGVFSSQPVSQLFGKVTKVNYGMVYTVGEGN